MIGEIKYLGTNIGSAYKDCISKVIQGLPISGNENSTDIMVLAHYSKNPSIEEFYASRSCNWTATLAFDSDSLHRIIGYDDKKFQSVYFIRLGVGYENYSKGSGGGFMDEHRVKIKLGMDSFECVAIKYNPNTSNYDLV